MGLAASQARLLTITSRKADCEFQSMRLSHQKIALSRNMTDISNEYQDALNQVSLVYDYYGTNDKSTVLSYGLLMTPGELNGHMPTLTTDAAGKVVLNSRYAAAARAAGIPTEGLGCLPSTDVRNKFLDGLAAAGFITTYQAEIYKEIEYNQQIGVGTTDLVTTTVTDMNLSELLDYYVANCDHTVYDNLGYEVDYNCQRVLDDEGQVHDPVCNDGNSNHYLQGNEEGGTHILRLDGGDFDDLNYFNGDLTIADILNNHYIIAVRTEEQCKDDNGEQVSLQGIVNDYVIKELKIWDWMFEEFANMISVPGDYARSNALEYAKQKTMEIINNRKNGGNYDAGVDIHPNGSGIYTTGDIGWAALSNIGFCCGNDQNNGSGNRDFGAISITHIAKAYLTYFAEKMEGSNSEYYISDSSNKTKNSVFIDDKFKFQVVTETGVNADQSLNSGHYDAMFNQLCLNGWVENDQVNDNEYLHHMYQSGKLFISTCNDDGFYYQGNYNTNKFIKEVADDEAIARAEAKYNSEKQRINSKEEVIDMKMKNLDTEISSLTTEYDTIKSLISNNIKKSFTRYDA